MRAPVQPRAGLASRARAEVRHAGSHVLVTVVVPSVAFIAGRGIGGLKVAVTLALLWNGGCLAARRLQRRRAGALTLLGSISLVLWGAVALILGSAQAFFLAPAIITAVTGVVFVGSAFTTKPLAAGLAGDLLPDRVAASDNPRMGLLWRAGSAVWGAEQILTATVSAWMVLRLSTTTYLATHGLVSWAICAIVLGVAALVFRRDLTQLLRPSVSVPAPAVPISPSFGRVPCGLC